MILKSAHQKVKDLQLLKSVSFYVSFLGTLDQTIWLSTEYFLLVFNYLLFFILIPEMYRNASIKRPLE